MLTFEDCLALCNLTEEEIAAIAEHEHIPEITAIEYGDYLIKTPNGERHIKRMIVEDIERCKAHGNLKHAKALEKVLEQFVLHHPKLKSMIRENAH